MQEKFIFLGFPLESLLGFSFTYLYFVDVSEGYRGVYFGKLECFLDTIIYLVGYGYTYTMLLDQSHSHIDVFSSGEIIRVDKVDFLIDFFG